MSILFPKHYYEVENYIELGLKFVACEMQFSIVVFGKWVGKFILNLIDVSSCKDQKLWQNCDTQREKEREGETETYIGTNLENDFGDQFLRYLKEKNEKNGNYFQILNLHVI